MYKKLHLLFILFLSISSIAQNETITFENSLKTSGSFIKDAFQIVNQKNGNLSVFLIDAKKIYGYLFDDNFEISKKISSEDRSRKYKVLIGSSVSSNNDYRVYLTNNKHDKFASINFSFKNNTATLNEFELDSNQERFVQTVTHNNKFYLISVVKGTSLLGIYTFDENANYTKKGVDFSSDRLVDKKGKKTNLFNLITNSYGFNTSADVHKIDENNPNSIEVTSELTKLYVRENKVLLTFDQFKSFTQILSIDLNTLEKEIRQIKKPYIEIKLSQKKANSYINGDHIYMLASTNDKFTFTIHDFNSGKLIKQYSATVNDTISFKNTPIIQKGGMYNNYREMEKTKKFLRKITAGDVGISVYKFKDNYHISLGGKQEIKSGGMMMPMGGFGMPIASFGSATVFFNPTYFAYNSYTNTKSTHIKGLFDVNFDHIEGEMEENVFDKIKNYQTNSSASKKGEIVFKYKDYYILGNYLLETNQYRLRQFKN